MQGTETVRVNLKETIRVMILYGTALANEAGQVLFFDDLYGHDTRLEAALQRSQNLARIVRSN
jgi:murein L,D-transpeptidase YcbB/YkuD